VDAGYDAICAGLAATGIGVPGRIVTCDPVAGIALAEGRMAPTAPPTFDITPSTAPARRGIVDPRRAPAPTRSMSAMP
jgi:hypothetical protein